MTWLKRVEPFFDLLDARYLPLLFAYAPQAYTVCAWQEASGAPTVIAGLAGIGFEFVSVGSIAWAERGAGWQAARYPAITALLFSVAVAVAYYGAREGALAFLHAGFPLVAYAYTRLMHSKEEVKEWEGTADLIADTYSNEQAALTAERAALAAELAALREQIAAQQQRQRQSHIAKAGFVYVLATDQGTHKIGMAVDVERRVKEIAGMTSQTIELVTTFATGDRRVLEQRLHECFADRRLRGEWFALTETDLDALLAIGPEVPTDQIDDTIDNLSLVVNSPVSIDLSVRNDLPEIVRLKDVDKLTFTQIGDQLGVTRQAAWQQYKAAKKVVSCE